MDVNFQAIGEALRRKMGGMPSGAGIPGGMPTTNAPMPSNPIAQMAANRMPQAQQSTLMPQPGNAMNPTAGAQSVLKKAAPDEATMITKALIDRHKVLGDQQAQGGGQPQPTPQPPMAPMPSL